MPSDLKRFLKCHQGIMTIKENALSFKQLKNALSKLNFKKCPHY
jgi:hypothetical protein